MALAHTDTHRHTQTHTHRHTHTHTDTHRHTHRHTHTDTRTAVDFLSASLACLWGSPGEEDESGNQSNSGLLNLSIALIRLPTAYLAEGNRPSASPLPPHLSLPYSLLHPYSEGMKGIRSHRAPPAHPGLTEGLCSLCFGS